MVLGAGEIAEIEAATRPLAAREADIAVIRPADFPLPTLAPRLKQRVADEVLNGRGFLLLRKVRQRLLHRFIEAHVVDGRFAKHAADELEAHRLVVEALVPFLDFVDAKGREILQCGRNLTRPQQHRQDSETAARPLANRFVDLLRYPLRCNGRRR